MKKKRLSKEKVAEIINLLKAGKNAKELAESYKVSVATIYNFITRLKRDGAPMLPKKRGRKPKLVMVKEGSNTIEAKKVETTLKMEQYIFVINGVDVSVSGKAKNVHISKDSMIVNF